MVGAKLTSQGTDDRAQLVLIGAISIAFILLGVVVVFNGVQYTETINSGSSSEDLEQAKLVKVELSDELKELDSDGASDSEIVDFVEEIYSPAKSAHSPVHLTATVSGNDVEITYSTPETTVTFEVNLP